MAIFASAPADVGFLVGAALLMFGLMQLVPARHRPATAQHAAPGRAARPVRIIPGQLRPFPPAAQQPTRPAAAPPLEPLPAPVAAAVAEWETRTTAEPLRPLPGAAAAGDYFAVMQTTGPRPEPAPDELDRLTEQFRQAHATQQPTVIPSPPAAALLPEIVPFTEQPSVSATALLARAAEQADLRAQDLLASWSTDVASTSESPDWEARPLPAYAAEILGHDGDIDAAVDSIVQRALGAQIQDGAL